MRLKEQPTLLGLDLGSSRVRLAAASRDRNGVRITAVAARDLPVDAVMPDSISEPELVSAVIEDAYRELGTEHRRCVLCVGPEISVLRVVRFPAMSASERRRAARFEAQRFASWNASSIPTVVRTHCVTGSDDLYAVGAVRVRDLDARVSCVKRAGLRPIAVDYEPYAYRRAFTASDAVLDVGYRRTVLHVFPPTGPLSLSVAGGGLAMTRAIAADLGIDMNAAERRKRLLGAAGAGDASRREFAAAIRETIAKARERCPELRRIVATGNGSRLPELFGDIESACSLEVETPICTLFRGADYPEDVLRSGAPDWTLAASLAAWKAAV